MGPVLEAALPAWPRDHGGQVPSALLAPTRLGETFCTGLLDKGWGPSSWLQSWDLTLVGSGGDPPRGGARTPRAVVGIVAGRAELVSPSEEI